MATTADELWEQPKPRSWRSKKKPATQPTTHTSSPQTHSKVHNASKPPRITPGLTPEKLLSEFRVMQKRFQATECCEHIKWILRRRRRGVEMKEAVCIGIGSLSADWEHRWRSMWQLVLFVEVVGYLGSIDPDLQMYAREPAFNALDINFLSQLLSITVLDTNEHTQSHITPSSFIFAPFVDWFILLPHYLKNKDPELYLGNEILTEYARFAGADEEKRAVVGECECVGSAFLKGRKRVRLVEFELHGNALNGLVVHLRVEEEEDG